MKTKHNRSSLAQRRLDRVVCSVFNVTAKQLFSPGKKRPAIDARLTCMYLQKQLLQLSYPAISRHFRKKSHGTSMNAYSTISGLIETDPAFRSKVERCIRLFEEYVPDRTKQRYNLHYLITQDGIRVSGPECTIYMPADKYDSLDGILRERIDRLVRKHNYSLQLTII